MSRSIFIAAALALAVALPAAPSYAEQLLYVSDAGSGSVCTVAQPCPITTALGTLLPTGTTNSRVVCVGAGSQPTFEGSGIFGANLTLEIDCPQGFFSNFDLGGNNIIVRLRGLTFRNSSFGQAVRFAGSGTLILEDCTFVDVSGTALDIEPTGPLTLVVTNSRVSNNTAGVLIKPAAGGSVTATFDGDTIVNNTGGLKTDSTSGAIKINVSNSTISYNTANGMNIIGGPGGQNLVNLSHDVIAENGQFGIVSNGANAAVFVDTTLFDENGTGAIKSLSGGNLVTYSSNRTIGGLGSGFTGTASLN